eukprot:gb/GECG01002741.1/.p1 GENE.gb/GECG01002741.1/~~gb/GECG01002741.1/.p1  ORF type:complete len:1636 (+),score=348.93 gb/GECG01002741.1/:1-4908(+)
MLRGSFSTNQLPGNGSEVNGESSSASVGSTLMSQNRAPQHSPHKTQGNSNDDPLAKRNPVWGDQHLFQKRMKAKDNQKRQAQKSKSYGRLPPVNSGTHTGHGGNASFRRQNTSGALARGQSYVEDQGGKQPPTRKGAVSGSVWDMDDVQFVQEDDEETTESGSQPAGSENEGTGFEQVEEELSNAFRRLLASFDDVPECATEKKLKDEGERGRTTESKPSKSSQRISIQQLAADQPSRPGHTITSYEYKKKRQETMKALVEEVSTIRERISTSLKGLNTKDSTRKRPLSGSRSQLKHAASEGAMAVADSDKAVQNSRVKALEAFDDLLAESLKVREAQAAQLQEIYQQQMSFSDREEQQRLYDQMKERMKDIQEKSDHKKERSSSPMRASAMAKSFMTQSHRALRDSLESRAAGSRGDRPILGAELSVYYHLKRVGTELSSMESSREASPEDSALRALREVKMGSPDGEAEPNVEDDEAAQFEEYLQSVLAMRPDFEGSKHRADSAKSKLGDLLHKIRSQHQRKIAEYEKELAERDQQIFQLNERATKAEKANEDLSYENNVLEARTRDVDRIEEDYRQKVYDYTIKLQNQKEEIGDLQNKLDRSQSEAASYRQRSLQAKEELSQWKEAYKQKEAEANEALEKAKTITTERQTMPSDGLSSGRTADGSRREDANVEELRAEIASLQDELGRRDNIARQYKNELDELKKQESEKDASAEPDPEHEELRREIEDLKKSLEQAQSDNEIAESECDTIQQKLSAANKEVDDLYEQKRSAETGLSRLEISLTELLNQIKGYSSFEGANEEVDSQHKSRGGNANLEGRVEQIQQLEKLVRNDTHQMCTLLDEKNKEINELQNQNQKMSARIEQIQQSNERKLKLYEGKASHETERSTYVAQTAEALREEVSRQRQSIKGYINQTHEMQDENYELRRQLQEKAQNDQTDKMKQQVEEDIKRMEELQQALQEQDQKLEQETEEQNRITLEKDSRIEELSKRCAELENERDEVNAKVQQLEEEKNDASQQAQEEQAARQRLENEYSEFNTRVEELQNQCEQAEYEKRYMETEVSGLREARDVLRLHNLQFTPHGKGSAKFAHGGDMSSAVICNQRPRSASSRRNEGDVEHGMLHRPLRARSNSMPPIPAVSNVRVDVEELKRFSATSIVVPSLETVSREERYKNAVTSFVWELTKPSDSGEGAQSERAKALSVGTDETEHVPTQERVTSAPGKFSFQNFDILNQPCLHLAMGTTDTGRTWYKIDPCGTRRFSDTDVMNKYKYEELHKYFREKEKEEQEALERGSDGTSVLHKHQFYSHGSGEEEESLIATKGYSAGAQKDVPASALSDLRQQVESLQQENAILLSENMSLGRLNGEYKNEIESYHDQVKELKTENQDLQQRVTALEEERDELKAQFRKLQDAYELLRGDCDYYEEKVDSLQEQCNSLQRENEHLNATTVAWSYHRRVEKRLSATVSSHESLEALQLQQADELEQARERLQELNRRKETLEEELRRTHSRLKAAYDHETKQWKTLMHSSSRLSTSQSSHQGGKSTATVESRASELSRLSSSSQHIVRRYGAIRKRLLTQINLLKSVIPADEAGVPKVKHVTAKDIVECASTLKMYVLKEFDALMEAVKEENEAYQ